MEKKARINAVVLVVLVSLPLFILMSRVPAQGEGPRAPSPLKVTVEHDPLNGKPLYLVVSGRVTEDKGYLCCTLYKKGFKKEKWWSEGKHTLKTLPRGEFEKKFFIAKDYYDGAWEVSLFSATKPKNRCTVVKGGCYFCRLWGFHLASLKSYKTDVIK